MKLLLQMLLVLMMGSTLPVHAGDNDDEHAQGRGPNPNPMLYRKDGKPFGADMRTWADRLTQWVYRQPLDQNPVLDQTGAACAVDQQGPVWFLPPIAGPAVFVGQRTCTIPRGKAILLNIGNVVAVFPRSDPNYRPEQGQLLSAFLAGRVKGVMDSVDRLEVSLNGRPLDDVLGYRFVTDGLFELLPHPSLVGTYDARLTGYGQPAVQDGFFMMFRPLRPGQHILRVFGTNTFGDNKTYIYTLQVQ